MIATAVLATTSIGLADADAVCPPLAGDAEAGVRIGAWALLAGPRLVTCGDGAALMVACGSDERLEVRLILAASVSGTTHLRFAANEEAALVTQRMAWGDGALVLRGADADRLVAQMTAGGALRVRVTAEEGDPPPHDLIFATAGLVDALPWLGCGDADACPARSCDR